MLATPLATPFRRNGAGGADCNELRSTDRAELHLFLRIHDTAMPLYHPLAWGAYVPTAAPDAPDGLTGLRLAPAWRNPILWWGSQTGWRREQCFD